MKKEVIGLTVLIAASLLLYNRLDTTSDYKGKRYEGTPVEITDDKESITQIQESPYEENIAAIRQYVETVYTRNKQVPNTNKLKEIVNQDILADIQRSFAADINSDYESKVKNAHYWSNKNSAVAIFNLKTTTKINTSEQSYLLEVKIENGIIIQIKTMTKLSN